MTSNADIYELSKYYFDKKNFLTAPENEKIFLEGVGTMWICESHPCRSVLRKKGKSNIQILLIATVI